MSKEVITTVATKNEVSKAQTGTKWYYDDYTGKRRVGIIAAIDGKAAAIGEFGHRVHDHIDHPGMGVNYTVEQLRRIFGWFGAYEVRNLETGEPLIQSNSIAKEVSNLRNGDFLQFGCGGNRPYIAMVRQNAIGGYDIAAIAGGNVGSIGNWSTLKNLSDVAEVKAALRYVSSPKILDRSEVPDAIQKANGL